MVEAPVNFYCRKCEYNLRGLTGDCCPECGMEFDRDDPKTYLNKSRTLWKTVRKIAEDITFAFVAGALFSSLTACIYAHDLEVIPAVLLNSLLVLTPVTIWTIIFRCLGRKRLASVTYWLVSCPLLGMMLLVWFCGGEGADLGMFLFFVMGSLAATSFMVLVFRR